MPDTENTLRPNTNTDATNESAESTLRPQTESESTLRPGTEAESTLRPEMNAESTLRPSDEHAEKTLHPGAQEEIDKIISQHPTEIILNKVKYNLVSVISEGTGEADILLVQSGSKQFALKLYYTGIKPPPNHEIMEIVHKAPNSGLLVDILEHGKWTNPQTKEERDYELMIYCEGGTLDQLKIDGNEKLLGEIALKSAASIDFLHKKQVIHRDIKPANFFFKGKDKKIEDMVLGDFGIAILCDKNGKAKIDYQLRTRIYAAPEYYLSIDGKIEINTKSDFYSLGMLLLTLWNGENIYKIPEFELINKKQNGKLPYPDDMSDRMLELVKALTLADPNSRAGFPEVVRWAKGETIYDIKAEKSDDRKFKIIFDPTKKQIASSPEELAKFMHEDKNLAIKYLYSGRIAKWLAENLRPELAVQIEEIAEKKYPQDETAGLHAACYLLDPDMPYYDLKNNPLTSSEEIALSLKTNEQLYKTVLTNKNDSLFLFFNSHGAGNITAKFAPMFKKGANNDDALRQLIYTLNPALPWVLTNTNGESFNCQTIEDIINVNYQAGLTDEAWMSITGESFLTWLSHRDMAVVGKIQSQKNYISNPWYILYSLDPKVSYTLQLDKDASDYFFTHSEVAEYLNIMMKRYIADSKDSYASGQLYNVCHIDDTRLYLYFKSKGGVYDDKIDWIRYCSDLDSKENKNKYAPYSWAIGVYKALKGLDYDPYYYFPKSDKYVYNLAQLEDIPASEQEEELQKSYLEYWLAIQYQENPRLDLSTKFAFEEETVKYVEHLEDIDFENVWVNNYRIATNTVEKNRKALKKSMKMHTWSKILFGGLTILLTSLVIFGAITLPMPEGMKDASWLPLAIGITSVVVALIVGIIIWFGAGLSLFWTAVIGVGTYFLARILFGLLFNLIAGYLNFVLAGLLLLFLIWAVIVVYLKNRPLRTDRDLLNPGFEEECLEPLHFAFKAKEGEYFKSSIGDRSYNSTQDIKQHTKKFYKWFIPLLFTSLLCGALLLFISPAYGFNKGNNIFKSNPYSQFTGKWTGTFDNRNAVLNITKAEKNGGVEADIEVKYSNLLSEKLTGTIDLDEKTIHFDDLFANGNLDGKYDGTFNDEMTEFKGVYENYKTKKQVNFVFVQKIKEETSDAEQQTENQTNN